MSEQIKIQLNIERQPNGPEGCLSSLTVRSIEMMYDSVCRVSCLINMINPLYIPEVDFESLLTTMVKNLHAISHVKHQYPTLLHHSQNFGRMMQEANKRAGKSGFYYFTKEFSYYPIPESGIPSRSLPILPKPKEVSLSPEILKRLYFWAKKHGKSVRRKTVRQDTIKFKHGTLPLNMYEVQELPGNPLVLHTCFIKFR